MRTFGGKSGIIIGARGLTGTRAFRRVKMNSERPKAAQQNVHLAKKENGQEAVCENSIACQICGSDIQSGHKRCLNCGAFLNESESDMNTLDSPMPIISIDHLLFAHFDVESGRMSYIELNGDKKLSGELLFKDGGTEWGDLKKLGQENGEGESPSLTDGI